MNYLFRDEWQTVPAYSSYPSCLTVQVQYTIPLARVTARDARVIERSWRKVRRFVEAEGFVGTWQKVRSKQTQEELGGDFHVVIAVGKRSHDTGERASAGSDTKAVVCLGTRHPRCAEVMLFHSDLVVSLDATPTTGACFKAITEAERKLKIGDEQWAALSGYNFYSDLPPPELGACFLQSVAASIAGQGYDSSDEDKGSYIARDVRARTAVSVVPSVAQTSETPTNDSTGMEELRAAVVAAGDYTRTVIVPALKRSGAQLHTMVDYEPLLAEHVRREFGFQRASTNWREAVADAATNVVIVASYHDSHARIAAEALARGKKVFLEKPPAVTREDLALLVEAATSSQGFLEIGYNRRYAPAIRKTKELLDEAPGATTILCVVKEVSIPDAHWYRWPQQGTRITGNICHWIDLAVYLLGKDCQPVEMSLTGQANAHPDEERGLNILFRDGSTVTIIATTRGDSTLGVQEWIEARRDDLTVRIDDYRRIDATRAGRTVYRRRSLRNRGHNAMYREALERMKNNSPARYTVEELRLTTLLMIQAREMAQTNIRCAPIDW